MAKPRSPAGRARETFDRLASEYPGTAAELCALNFETPFQLLTATILSAQTTDERVNMATPALFEKYPDAKALRAADLGDVEKLVQSTGFFRNKAKSIVGMADAVAEQFDGQIPHDRDQLVTLPGVGRKTANVLRSVALDEPGLPVDTHVIRLAGRLGITTLTDPVKIEHELMPMLAPADWGLMSLRLILHGRAVCVARRPKCDVCVLNDFCPSSLVKATKQGKAAQMEGPVEDVVPERTPKKVVPERTPKKVVPKKNVAKKVKK